MKPILITTAAWMLLLVAVNDEAIDAEEPNTNESAAASDSIGRSEVSHADVVVYGSTPGGFCAAIAAAREGASVILLEPTDHVGGMNTGGLSHCDSNQMVRSTVMGLFDEWHKRVVKDYTDRGLKAPYEPTRKDQSLWTFEPHVAMRVTMQMLEEAGVTVLTERYLTAVEKGGPRITSLVTKNGTFTAKVFVDGTYEGDLMAAAGVDWTIGREGRDEYGESLAGKQYPKKKMAINGLNESGKLLPLLTTEDAGPEEAGDKNIMTYSFRLCLTADPNNRVEMPKPANYDPSRFEIVRRALRAGERAIGFDLYPLPGKKLDGNNSIGGQFSLGLVGGGKNWHSADEAGRQEIWEAHKQYTLELFHFLISDPDVPAGIRNKFARLGLCKDEFASYGHFSPALYVRESRRMMGMYVIRQQDILDSPSRSDPIAISSFPIDSHDCQRIALADGGVINEGTIFPVRRKNPKQGYAYHVPYRSILPHAEQCENLVVPVALSCTHVGISSLRIEGTWMIIGQSAGIAAALAASSDVPVQELSYVTLRERLLAQGQVLELPDVPDLSASAVSIDPGSLPEIVLDDATATLAGEWTHSINFAPHIGKGYVFSGEKDSKAKGDGESVATFRFKASKSGEYQLLMAYSAHESRATNVPVTVSSGPHTKTLVVDQTIPLPPGKHFRPLETVVLSADVESIIQITNAETTGFVILDALQLLPVE
ncbi:FAD-dependent oxidoreductase [Stieleria varia]|uniref:Putative FAD-binding dehydrogenase n=1 Tax=Stieleria varia TaxID=2528005 RepID=A0A5C6B0J7_9BACT|nr:FAD-dependent oxidoreductase [Stieleria varia]TWU04816.1 putative FAD-binding dehydrogenase [Stieleria varia]